MNLLHLRARVLAVVTAGVVVTTVAGGLAVAGAAQETDPTRPHVGALESAAANPGAAHPGNVVATAGDYQLHVSWKPAHGGGVTAYLVSTRPATRELVVSDRERSALLDDVPPGRSYVAVVTALHGSRRLGSATSTAVSPRPRSGIVTLLPGRDLLARAAGRKPGSNVVRLRGHAGIPAQGASLVLLRLAANAGHQSASVTLRTPAGPETMAVAAGKGLVRQLWLPVTAAGVTTSFSKHSFQSVHLLALAWVGGRGGNIVTTSPAPLPGVTSPAGEPVPSLVTDGGVAGAVQLHLTGTLQHQGIVTVSAGRQAQHLDEPAGSLDEDVWVPVPAVAPPSLHVTLAGGARGSVSADLRGYLTRPGSRAAAAGTTAVTPQALHGAVDGVQLTFDAWRRDIPGATSTTPATGLLARITVRGGAVSLAPRLGSVGSRILSSGSLAGTTDALLPLDTDGHLDLVRASPRTAVTVIALGYVNGDLVVPSTTLRLPAAALSQATSSASGSTLTFPLSAIPVRAVAGDVLVLPVGGPFPHGRIVAITTLLRTGSTVTVGVTPAGIADAFPVLSVHALVGQTVPTPDVAVAPHDIGFDTGPLSVGVGPYTRSIDGVTVSPGGEGGTTPEAGTTSEPSVAPSEEASDPGHAPEVDGSATIHHASVTASADLDLDFSIDIDIELFNGVFDFLGQVHAMAQAHVNAQVDASVEGSVEFPLADPTLPPVDVGPIVVTPTLGAKLSVDGDVSAKGSYDFGISRRSYAFVHVGNHAHTADIGLGPTMYAGAGLDVSGDADLTAEIELTSGLLLYDLAGPYDGLTPKVEGRVSTEGSPCIDVTSGLESKVGLDVDHLAELPGTEQLLSAIGVDTDELTYTQPLLENTIYQREAPCPIIPEPKEPTEPPAPGAQPPAPVTPVKPPTPTNTSSPGMSPSPSPSPSVDPTATHPVLSPQGAKSAAGDSVMFTDTTDQADTYTVSPSNAGYVSSGGVLSVSDRFNGGDVTVTATNAAGLSGASTVAVRAPLCSAQTLNYLGVERMGTGADGLQAVGQAIDGSDCRGLDNRVLDADFLLYSSLGPVIIEQRLDGTGASATSASIIAQPLNGDPETILAQGVLPPSPVNILVGNDYGLQVDWQATTNGAPDGVEQFTMGQQSPVHELAGRGAVFLTLGNEEDDSSQDTKYPIVSEQAGGGYSIVEASADGNAQDDETLVTGLSGPPTAAFFTPGDGGPGGQNDYGDDDDNDGFDYLLGGVVYRLQGASHVWYQEQPSDTQCTLYSSTTAPALALTMPQVYDTHPFDNNNSSLSPESTRMIISVQDASGETGGQAAPDRETRVIDRQCGGDGTTSAGPFRALNSVRDHVFDDPGEQG